MRSFATAALLVASGAMLLTSEPATASSLNAAADALPRMKASSSSSANAKAAMHVDYPRDYLLYKQCNATWGSNMMGVVGDGERNTICNEGCAMSCVTMMLATLGVKNADGTPINPGTFNAWLIANGGYMCAAQDCNNLNLTYPTIRYSGVSLIGELPKPSYADIVAGLAAAKTAYIAHVRNRHHFVLLLGPTADGLGFFVNDPGFDQASYTYDDIADIIMYAINQ